MKRCAHWFGSVFLMLVVLLCIVPSSKAVKYSPNFNSDDLSKLPGYTYDKFDKKWKYSTSYEVDGTNLYIKLVFEAVGYQDEVYTPLIQVQIKDLENDTIRVAKKIRFLVNENVYSFNKGTNEKEFSLFQVGKLGKEMLLDILRTNSISVRLSYDGFLATVDIDSFLLQKFWISSLDSFNYWDSFSDELLVGIDSLSDVVKE